MKGVTALVSARVAELAATGRIAGEGGRAGEARSTGKGRTRLSPGDGARKQALPAGGRRDGNCARAQPGQRKADKEGGQAGETAHSNERVNLKLTALPE